MQEDVYQGDGLNLYAYCDNNPVMYSDPSGYAKQKCGQSGDTGEGMGDAAPDNNNRQEDGRRADFYVTPDGTVIPATGYRYISEMAPYLENMENSMLIPANAEGTYFSFNNYDVANPGALQVPHDASIKVSFDTLQIIDDISVPYGNWGMGSHLEPITMDFPKFGPGGATQVITHSEIKIDTIIKLPKD